MTFVKGSKPLLAVTLGDPAGIGPEVAAKALADPRVRRACRTVVVGDAAIWARARGRAGAAPDACVDVPAEGRIRPGRWNAASGRASWRAVDLAADLALAGRVDGVVTAPICKAAWHAAGKRFPGHTEFLARKAGAKAHAMLFVGGPFRVVLATIHEPLRRVPRLLTSARIERAAHLAVAELRSRFGLPRPRVAVAGLNPHAGEGGLLGREEQRVIAPAVRALRASGLAVEGPLPADTLFARAGERGYDLIVTMYHDQGLIPFKLTAPHRGVNVTCGLPFVRTSPDHGTAFELAGRNRAEAGSMTTAVLTAAEMVRRSHRA